MGPTEVDPQLAECRRRTEQWFIHRGIPHFIDGYSARTDIFTRAFPVLALIVLVEMSAPMRDEAAWWFNLGVIVAGVVALLGVVALVNSLRGRPWHRRPDSIGALELAAFVLVGPLVVLAFGETRQAVITLGANVVALAAIYIVTSYGLIPTTRWALRQFTRQLADVGELMIRSLPLLLVFTMFMFINAEMWSIAAEIPALLLSAAIALLAAVGIAFMLLRLPRELEGAADLGTWTQVCAQVAHTPVQAIADELGCDDPDGEAGGLERHPLSTRERINIGLVLFVGQGIQIVFVALAIWVFYVVLGALIVSPETVDLWTGAARSDVLLTWHLGDDEIVVTGALLRCAAFIAAIAGLQFTVSALTDKAYREEFVEQTLGMLRTDFAVRAVYLARLVD
jgi:hypothetical protein